MKQFKTVDSEHRSLCSGFQDASSQVLELQQRKRRAKHLLDAAKAAGAPWQDVVSLRDELLGLQEALRQTKEAHDEVGYYVDTAPILFKYYDTFENAKTAAAAPPPGAGASSSATGILAFFSKSSAARSQPPATGRAASDDEEDASSSRGVEVSSRKEDRGSLYERYMEIVDEDYVKEFPEQDDALCVHCGSRSKCFISNEGLAYCTVCSTTERVLLELEKPSYKEPPTEVTYYNYRRINHFNEWLSQIQAREFTDIPNDVIDMILVELKKQKIANMATLTPQKVREILRKLRINRYYEHTAYIMFKLTGIPPVRFGDELEARLRQMFFAIQGPFLKHAPASRKNFLSYSYCLRQCLFILEKPELATIFPLLKSRDKLLVQEKIWKSICEDLKWPFHKTM